MMIDNETLRRLDSAAFAALLHPIPIAALRRVTRNPKLGKDFIRQYFAGFRIEKIDHPTATRFFEAAARGTRGTELASALLDAWLEAVPVARDISQAVLSRPNPFVGPVTRDFYDRLEAVVDEECLAALKIITTAVLVADDSNDPSLMESVEAPVDVPDDHEAPGLLGSQILTTEPDTPLVAPAQLPAVDELFETAPRPFQTVVHRDRWLWANANLINFLLGSTEESRLLDMPDPEASGDLAGLDWAHYAERTARALQETRNWSSAVAYWSAAARFWAREGDSHEAELISALNGMVRSNQLDAGMPLIEQRDELHELAATGFRSASTPVRSATVKSLLLAASIDGSLYERLAPRGHTAEQLAMAIRESLPRLQKQLQGMKLAREIFDRAAREYTARLEDLRESVQALAANPTIDRVRGGRPKLLETLSNLEQFVLPYDNLILSTAQELLGPCFTAYDEASDDDVDTAYQKILNNVASALTETRKTGSRIGTCLITPLVLATGAAVNTHYQGSIRQKTPDLRIRVLKPAYQLSADISGLDLKLTNEGSGSADKCTLQLLAPHDRKITFEPAVLNFDRIEPGQALQQSCDITGLSPTEPLELPYELEYSDRLGVHRGSGQIRISRQRDVDWFELETLAPYTMLSITEPQRLKGRDEQLSTLRRAVRNQTSYLITGQKRVGKTSLVRVFLAEQEVRPDIVGLYVPLGELSAVTDAQDLGQVGHDLASRIYEGYRSRFGPAKRSVPPLRDFRQSFSGTFPSFVREFARDHGIKLVIALDDLDELPSNRFTGELGRVFFLALRALIDSGVCFFFVGSERLPRIIDEQAERLNTVRRLDVDYLDSQALTALVCEPTRSILEYNADAIEEIAVWSARNPYFATLICQKIWDLALDNRDYCVVRSDVERAVSALVRETTQNHFKHFWSDSPLTEDEDRKISQTFSGDVFLAISTLQDGDPLTFVPRRAVAERCSTLKPDEAERYVDELLNRRVIEADRERKDLIRFRVPLFAHWLQSVDPSELRSIEPERGSSMPRFSRQEEVPARELVGAVQNLRYQGQHVTSDEVRSWLAQFGDVGCQRLMLALVRRLNERGAITEEKFQIALETLKNLIEDRCVAAGIATRKIQKSKVLALSNWYVTHADDSGKSGSAVVSDFANKNRVPKSNCGTPEKIVAALSRPGVGRSVLVCVDDFVGTGNSAVAGFETNVKPLLEAQVPDWRERLLIAYAAVVGTDHGISYIEEALGPYVTVFTAFRLAESDKAFSSENDIFSTPEARERAHKLAYMIGSALERKHPLGYEDSQALIIFPTTVPNNTLPIFYKQGRSYQNKPWIPLFPRP